MSITTRVRADLLLALGLLLTLPGVELLRRRLSPGVGWLAVAGQSAITISILATIAAGHEVLDVVYIVGTVAWLAGTIAFAVAAARRRIDSRVVVIGLPVACLLALALSDTGGALLLGATWIILGRSPSQWASR